MKYRITMNDNIEVEPTIPLTTRTDQSLYQGTLSPPPPPPPPTSVIKIQLITFGVESGKKPNVDTLNHPTFRCDWIPNPSSSSRKNTTGQSKKLRKEILAQPGVEDFVENCTEKIINEIGGLIQCHSGNNDDDVYEGSNDDFDESHEISGKQSDSNSIKSDGYCEEKEFKFAFSCAHGKHRSISVAIEVGNSLTKKSHGGILVEYHHHSLGEGKETKKGRKNSHRKQHSRNLF